MERERRQGSRERWEVKSKIEEFQIRQSALMSAEGATLSTPSLFSNLDAVQQREDSIIVKRCDDSSSSLVHAREYDGGE